MTTQSVGLPQQSIPFGEDFEFDLRPRRLRRGSRVLKMERIPLEILLLLLERPGEIVTREEIVARVWGDGVFLDTDNSIRGAIRKIRHVLKDDPEQPRFIQTVTGRGYRFIAPITGRAPEVIPFPTGPNRPETRPDREDGELLAVAQAAAPTVREPKILHPLRWLLLGLVSGIAVVAAFVLYQYRRAEATPAKIKSLAVLPLKYLSGDQEHAYLADAMTEELIGRLAAIHDLRVISHTSVLQFQAPKETVPVIARKLGVDSIMEGSVIRDGNRIRVHAQLIRAANDEHFWSETYDREMGDVLSLESEIAQSIARKVEVTLTGQEQALLGTARKISPEVYDASLKGFFANGNTKAGIEQSIAFFEEAIRKDPSYAPPYLGLASAYESLASVYGGGSPGEARSKSISAIRKALELDPTIPQAHVLLGNVYDREWQWNESGTEFRRALDLSPNNVNALSGYAFWLLCQGRTEEAVALDRRARELDPMNVELLINNGFHFFLARHFDEAIQSLRSVVAVQPDGAVAHWFMGYNLIATGQPEQAIPELEKAVQLSDRSPAVIGVLIRAYAHAGRRADALRMLEELKQRSKTGYVPAGAFINAYLGLGDNEQAFVWLEKGYAEKSGIMPILKVHPHFDPIRNDPRFKDLLHRVGLDQESH